MSAADGAMQKGKKQSKNPVTIVVTGFLMAEKEGFEPSRPFRGLHDFQSCALDQLGDFSIVADCFYRYSYSVSQQRTVVIIPELFPKSSLFSNFLRRAPKGPGGGGCPLPVSLSPGRLDSPEGRHQRRLSRRGEDVRRGARLLAAAAVRVQAVHHCILD